MRSTNALPAKGEALTCRLCGLKSYSPVVITCAQLKGETSRRVQCADTNACNIRVNRTARLQAKRAGGAR